VALKGGLWGRHCWRMHHVAGRSMSGTLIMGLKLHLSCCRAQNLLGSHI